MLRGLHSELLSRGIKTPHGNVLPNVLSTFVSASAFSGMTIGRSADSHEVGLRSPVSEGTPLTNEMPLSLLQCYLLRMGNTIDHHPKKHQA